MCECGPSGELCTKTAVFKTIEFKNAWNGEYRTKCASKCEKKKMCKGFQITNTMSGNDHMTSRAQCELLNQEVTGFSKISSTRLLKEEDKNTNKDKNKSKKENTKKDKNENKDEEEVEEETTTMFTCGMLQSETPHETESPSAAPIDPKTSKFIKHVKSKCEAKSRKTHYSTIKDLNIHGCENKCSDDVDCKSFQFEDRATKPKCFLYNHRTKLKSGSERHTCGISKPLEIQKCELKVVHEHKFKSVDNAPYYGAHTDFLEITKKKDEESMCSYYYEKTPWCKYNNSREGGDSAQVWNVEDEYYTPQGLRDEEVLSKETFRITDAAHDSTIIKGWHYFDYYEVYYPDYDEWNDHMMATRVKVYNLSNPKQDVVGKKRGYSHPVSKEVPTHIKDKKGNFKVNQKYEGNIEIEIKCTNGCWCSVKKFKTSKGNVYAMTDGSRSDGNNRARNVLK